MKNCRHWKSDHPKADPASLTEENLAEHLSAAHIIDSVLLIQAGEEHHISNFYFGNIHIQSCFSSKTL